MGGVTAVLCATALVACGSSTPAKWHAESVPAPGTLNDELASVSCASHRACTAVGWINAGHSGYKAFAVRSDGTTWTEQQTSSPDRDVNQLLSVSCASLSTCTAIGGAGAHRLVEAWAGSRWSSGVSAYPHDVASEAVRVLCLKSSECRGAGTYYDRAGTLVYISGVLHGTTWRTESASRNRSELQCSRGTCIGGEPSAVSCIGTACVEVITTDSGPSAQRWTATTKGPTHPKTERLPMPTDAKPSGPGFALSSISCSSTSACMAVGDYNTTSGARFALAERWNGGKWELQSVPRQSGVTGDELRSVSCTSPTFCVAVGRYGKGGRAYPFAVGYF